MLKKYSYDEKVRIMYEIIESNRSRGGITYGELVEILITLFEHKYNRSNNPIIKKLLQYNNSRSIPYNVDVKLLKNGKKVKFSSPVILPPKIRKEFVRKKHARLQNGLDDQLIKMLDTLTNLVNENKNRGLTLKEAESFLRVIFKQKCLNIAKIINFGKFYGKPINKKFFVRQTKDVPLIIPNDYKEEYKLLVEVEGNVFNLRDNNVTILYLDRKLIKSEDLTKLYKDNSKKVFDYLVKDIISKYRGNFKICIFEDDLLELDKKKNDRVSFYILKFISTSENIEFVRKKRPASKEDIINFCKKNSATLVSGSEKLLSLAILNNVRTYIPKEYIKQTPNPLKGKGIVVIDSNIASPADIDYLCSKFGTIAISDIQLEEIGMGGYFARICAYYGMIKRTSLIEQNKDRSIVEFCKKVKADMLYSNDYGCIAFAKMQRVPCTLIKNKHFAESTAVSLIQQVKEEELYEELRKNEGEDIRLDFFEKCMKKGNSRFVINNFCVEFKNSMYRNSSTLENGGYIFVKNGNLAIQIKVIDKEKRIGRITSVRRTK